MKTHFVSRYDDGEVAYNIEATDMDRGGFSAGRDADYVRMYKLPQKAIDCGSDLRRLTMREMIGAFFSLRARHFRDIGNMDRADSDYAMSRVLLPTYRNAYVAAMIPTLKRGEELFERNEVGHPHTLFEDLAPDFAPHLLNANHQPPAFNFPMMSTPFQQPMFMQSSFSTLPINKGLLDEGKDGQ